MYVCIRIYIYVYMYMIYMIYMMYMYSLWPAGGGALGMKYMYGHEIHQYIRIYILTHTHTHTHTHTLWPGGLGSRETWSTRENLETSQHTSATAQTGCVYVCVCWVCVWVCVCVNSIQKHHHVHLSARAPEQGKRKRQIRSGYHRVKSQSGLFQGPWDSCSFVFLELKVQGLACVGILLLSSSPAWHQSASVIVSHSHMYICAYVYIYMYIYSHLRVPLLSLSHTYIYIVHNICIYVYIFIHVYIYDV